MDSPFLGLIALFGFNFAPRGWAFCAGQIMAIAQNQAIFSLLGTTYGGNGQTTFALPDLRGRVPIGNGQGPGLTPRTLGEMAGTETVTLISTQIPQHFHAVAEPAVTSLGTIDVPSTSVILSASPKTGSGPNAVALKTYSDVAANTTLKPFNTGPAGGNQPHENIQPYLVLNYSIALQGIFPSRN
ncbi:microcystin-dependent protein [Pedobacter sp. W3I1]|uniref:phage tail protein n=1 Tax=Pedobacter sp. W3I1 TaxID=3042291 RepID=UPI0027803872|nr:tail fiber protein [Pedobacter sp. W3I1]MDQ0639578.1 microcystin-dependent protein [Pedobacter sp. W3I1]